MRRRTVVGAGARVLDGSDDAGTVTGLAISGGGEKGAYMNRPYEVGCKTIESRPAWSRYRPRCSPTPLGGVKAAAG